MVLCIQLVVNKHVWKEFLEAERKIAGRRHSLKKGMEVLKHTCALGMQAAQNGYNTVYMEMEGMGDGRK